MEILIQHMHPVDVHGRLSTDGTHIHICVGLEASVEGEALEELFQQLQAVLVLHLRLVGLS